ncbi:MAG: toll/interleukin-1 receptor domain-containing protein [Desulfobaccales bacterium]
MENQEANPPIVFISYSHDDHSHKKWVSELSSRLVENGVEVILDQWDLGLGDDIPKFMEHSVTRANRVLMVCTEAYVRKADEGEGGVGYEAMIVTGELVRNLGTAKFIPIIRQNNEGFLLPKSVCTRLAVNLSDSQKYEEQFQLLLRELHQEPTTVKPPLGKNPFTKKQSDVIIKPINKPIHIPDITDFDQDPTLLYKAALDIARQGDLVAWRRIVRQAKLKIGDNLAVWHQEITNSKQINESTFFDSIVDGTSIYSPIFSVALSGVESGKQNFNNQISILDEILFPTNWNWSGDTRIVYFPYLAGYIYQAIHGAMCLLTNQLSLSIKLVSSKFELTFDNQKKPLYLFPEIIGWPSSLGGNSSVAWKILIDLPNKWIWLHEAFGEDFQAAVCAYYMALSILEFSYKISFPDQVIGDWPLIPPSFRELPRALRRKAYKMMISDADQVRNIWRQFNIQDEKMKSSWPEWVKLLYKWTSRPFGVMEKIEIEDLFIDI